MSRTTIGRDIYINYYRSERDEPAIFVLDTAAHSGAHSVLLILAEPRP